jgi:TPR repeat protein
MARHQHYTMGIEAKWRERAYVETCAVFKEQERRDAASTTYYRVNPTLNFKNASDDLILYTCWFAYIGGQPAFLPGEVMPDLRFVREALDYLIKERKSVDAIFLKGFILKYGLGVHGKPNLQAAREHLDAAARAGVGSAAQELRNLDEHLVLGSVRSVHTEDYWETTALAG